MSLLESGEQKEVFVQEDTRAFEEESSQSAHSSARFANVHILDEPALLRCKKS